MGGIVSRISPDVTFDHGINESFNRLKNSFDRTPKYKVIDDRMVDPRSATLEIHRTPLCLLDLANEEGSTPVTRNRKKSKRRSSSHLSDDSSTTDVSRSFEFSSGSANRSHLFPWEPTNKIDEEIVKEQETEGRYDVVVEELRECLTKVTMTTVYQDESPESPKQFDQSKPLSPSNKVGSTGPQTPVNKFAAAIANITPSKMETPPMNKDSKKDWIWSPDYFINSKSPIPKERTPLGTVSTNTVTTRQLNAVSLRQRGKFWRGPLDERAKLKFDGENTPPHSLLPPFGSPKSAPPANRHLHFPLK